MIAAILSWLTGRSLSTWIIGVAAIAAAGYVGATQLVLHNRQSALDDAVAAGQKLAATNATLTSQLDQVTTLNAGNLRVLAELQADHQRDLADIQARSSRAEAIARDLAELKVRNAQDPDADATLADRCPALDRLFDRMFEPDAPGAAPGDRDEDRARRDQAPGRPAVVPR